MKDNSGLFLHVPRNQVGLPDPGQPGGPDPLPPTSLHQSLRGDGQAEKDPRRQEVESGHGDRQRHEECQIQRLGVYHEDEVRRCEEEGERSS